MKHNVRSSVVYNRETCVMSAEYVKKRERTRMRIQRMTCGMNS